MGALPLAGLVEAMTLPSSYPDGMLLSSFALAIMLWIMGRHLWVWCGDVEASLRAWRWWLEDRGAIGEEWPMVVFFVGVWSLWGMVGVCHCCCGGLTIILSLQGQNRFWSGLWRCQSVWMV
jgi:hypothetical protein